MSDIRVAYGKKYADEFDAIFRQPKVNKALLCTHRAETQEFCPLHQRGCGLHSNLEPDAHCECVPCFPKPPISNVRYAGVCQCEIYEHCAKCDPDFFKAPHPGTYDSSIGDNLGVPHTDACKKIGKTHSGECPV